MANNSKSVIDYDQYLRSRGDERRRLLNKGEARATIALQGKGALNTSSPDLLVEKALPLAPSNEEEAIQEALRVSKLKPEEIKKFDELRSGAMASQEEKNKEERIIEDMMRRVNVDITGSKFDIPVNDKELMAHIWKCFRLIVAMEKAMQSRGEFDTNSGRFATYVSWLQVLYLRDMALSAKESEKVLLRIESAIVDLSSKLADLVDTIGLTHGDTVPETKKKKWFTKG